MSSLILALTLWLMASHVVCTHALLYFLSRNVSPIIATRPWKSVSGPHNTSKAVQPGIDGRANTRSSAWLDDKRREVQPSRPHPMSDCGGCPAHWGSGCARRRLVLLRTGARPCAPMSVALGDGGRRLPSSSSDPAIAHESSAQKI